MLLLHGAAHLHKPGLTGGQQKKVFPPNGLGLNASLFSAPSVALRACFWVTVFMKT